MMRMLTGLAAVFLLALVTVAASPGRAADRVEAPSVVELERLLRETLASKRPGPWTIRNYRHARLLDFPLRQLTQLGTYSWWAEVDLEFEFGPPPSGVIGFQRTRQGLYHLHVDKRTGDWRLDRFNPAAVIKLLPVRRQ